MARKRKAKSGAMPLFGGRQQARAVENGELSREVWILVQTHYGQERICRDSLLGSGFEVYLPLKVHRTKDGAMVPRAYYPRFLFVRATREVERWQVMFSARGFRQVMGGRDGAITGLTDAFVASIKAAEIEGYIGQGLVPGMPKCDLSRDDKVLIDGMYPGLFHAIDGRRVTVLIHLAQHDKRVIVDWARLAAVA